MDKDELTLDIGKMKLDERTEKIGLLDLDDYSLGMITSCLDLKSLNSFARTCKRLNSIANDRQCWNDTVLFRKVSQLIQNAWFQGWFGPRGYPKYQKCSLSRLVNEGLSLGQNLAALSSVNAKFNWRENGAFVFKLYSYLSEFKTDETHMYPQSQWLIHRKKLTFKFMHDLMVEISVMPMPRLKYVNADDANDNDGDNDEERDDYHYYQAEPRVEDKFPFKRIKIKAYVDGKCVLIYKTPLYSEPHTLVNSDTEDVSISNDPASLKLIIDVINENLPSITTPLSVGFLMDFLLKFPFKVLDPFNKTVKFVEDEENKEPTWDGYFEELAERRKGHIEKYRTNCDKLTTEMTDYKDEIDELIFYLGLLLEKKDMLYKNLQQCYNALEKVDLDLLLQDTAIVKCLLRRVDFLNSQFLLFTFDTFECVTEIRLLNGNVLRVLSHWENEDIIDEGKNTIAFNFISKVKHIVKWKLGGLHIDEKNISELMEITELLQACINVDLERDDKLLSNKVTAKFFVSMVKGLSRSIYISEDCFM